VLVNGTGVDEQAIVARLRSAGCVFAEDEARLLVEAAPDAARLVELVDRRVSGTPLEYVLGWSEFRGLRVVVDDGVFVPRRRTEFLVDLALAEIDSSSTVLDLCCGVGALAASLLAEGPSREVLAADIDPLAVACARRNVPADSVFLGDLFAALPSGARGRLDVVVVNAPYVPTAEIAFMPAEARDFEAALALDGGSDGLDVHRRVAAEARDELVPGGLLVIETSERQAERTRALFADQGFVADIRRDDERDATAVTARAPGVSRLSRPD
jgi:release factor glutamine methyltransferase